MYHIANHQGILAPSHSYSEQEQLMIDELTKELTDMLNMHVTETWESCIVLTVARALNLCLPLLFECIGP